MGEIGHMLIQTGEGASGVQDDTDWGEIVHRIIQIGERVCTE